MDSSADGGNGLGMGTSPKLVRYLHKSAPLFVLAGPTKIKSNKSLGQVVTSSFSCLFVLVEYKPTAFNLNT